MNVATERGVRKQQQGVVLSNRMQKTIVVSVERRIRHPLYGKEMMTRRKYYAHDEKREAQIGDVVRLVETRPMSRLKRWRLVEVVRRAAKPA